MHAFVMRRPFRGVEVDLRLHANERALMRVEFVRGALSDDAADERSLPEATVLRDAVEQLTAYCRGDLREFDMPLEPEGSDFQRAVWRGLAEIPWGTTRTYGELAQSIGRPRAVRAVGAANGANPIPVVLPCHRVIGANGSLTGFGGGLDLKRWLLVHEGALLT